MRQRSRWVNCLISILYSILKRLYRCTCLIRRIENVSIFLQCLLACSISFNSTQTSAPFPSISIIFQLVASCAVEDYNENQNKPTNVSVLFFSISEDVYFSFLFLIMVISKNISNNMRLLMFSQILDQILFSLFRRKYANKQMKRMDPVPCANTFVKYLKSSRNATIGENQTII